METQTVRKTYKYKLKPTSEQERAMAFVLRRCRELYNAALQERKEAWHKRGVTSRRRSRAPNCRPSKRRGPNTVTSTRRSCRMSSPGLDRAFQAFFRRVKNGETPGYPRFHGANRYNSFTYKQFGNGAALENGFLVLSKIGRIAVRWSRPLEGTPKTVTISKEADGWYVCFSCADVPMQPLARRLDKKRASTWGSRCSPRFLMARASSTPAGIAKRSARLKTAQRRVSRRKKGSTRRRKAVNLLAKAHQKVHRQRQDFHHKTALALVRANDTIYHENLQPANMVKHHHLAKSISDAGWGAFLTILAYKAACAGRRVVAVNPAYTSQTCTGCGVVVSKGLSVRWHSCPDCGTSLHRDHNAAKNIERLGQSLRGGVALAAS